MSTRIDELHQMREALNPLVANARDMLGMSHEDVERQLSVLMLHRLRDLAERHERAKQEAFDMGFRSAGGSIFVDPK